MIAAVHAGTPVIYYGDEIGMGDNIYLGDRMVCARQCSGTGGWNGGFSAADPERAVFADDFEFCVRIPGSECGVAETSEHSLLSWTKVAD